MSRRLVGVAVSAVDVLHPESDLRLVAGAAGEMDVLVARVDRPEPARRTLPVDAPDYDTPETDGPVGEAGPPAGTTVPMTALPASSWALPAPESAELPDPPALPAGLHLHRLDLRWRVQDADEPALVAALSELIGFDPDDRVFCVAPAPAADGILDPEERAVGRAVRRVAQVYGLPVLHYRRVSGHADGLRALAVHPEPAV